MVQNQDARDDATCGSTTQPLMTNVLIKKAKSDSAITLRQANILVEIDFFGYITKTVFLGSDRRINEAGRNSDPMSVITSVS